MTVRMRKQQDWLLRVIDELACETWPILVDHRNDVFAWNIFRANDNEFTPRNPVAEFDFQNASAWDAAAHGGAIDHVWKRDVVDIPGCAAHLRQAFFAKRRRTDY